MSTEIGQVVRELIPVFADYEAGIVETVTGVVGGSYSITDTLMMETQADDYWNTAQILYVSGNLQWTWHTVSDYTGVTNTLVITGATAPEAGDEFIVFKGPFSMGKMMRAINSALVGLRVMKEDESLAVVDEQVAYTLPAGVRDVRIVELLNADDELVYEHQHWDEEDGKLRFRQYLPVTGRSTTIRLKYAGAPDRVSALDDETDVPYERLLWESAAQLIKEHAKSGQVDKRLEVMWAGIEREMLMARAQYPMRLQMKIKGRNL